MSIKVDIINKTTNLLSGLANNSDSILPMAVKDTISNCAIVHTYHKEGGKDDARERAIEEFGTGIVWLGGIPFVKAIIDKTIYPLLGLDPKLDIRVLKDPQKLSQIKKELENTANPALLKEKEIFKSIDQKAFLYKGMFVGKFITATALSAIALSKIIKYKQKTTQERIKKDYYEDKAPKVFIDNKLKNDTIFKGFSTKKTSKQTSFKGIASAFMYNPIINTSLLDCVITGTRLKEARHGEKKEVALKEGFQIFFIYAIAKPIQIVFEKIGKALKMPIETDPKVLFAKNLKEKLKKATETIKEIETDKNTNLETQIRNLDVKNPLIELLDKNGVISTLKNNMGEVEAISYFKPIEEGQIKKTFADLKSLNQNIINIKGIKAFKVGAVLGNIAIAALAMGVLQPKVNIWMRKILNNGDNRNPAIVAQEKQMHQG